MNFSYLLISIFAESAGKTVDKLNYRRNNIAPRNALFLTFFMMSLCTAGYVFFMPQPQIHLSLNLALLLTGIAIFSFLGNVFDEVSLKTTGLSEREPLINFIPILAGLIGYLLFPEQRDPAALVAFVLGTSIVYWGVGNTHIRKSHNKGMFYLLIGVSLYATLPSMYGQVIKYMSPAELALFRSVAVLILASLFFAPKNWKGFNSKRVHYSFVAGAIYAVGAITSLYAIQAYGVVLTMMFLMLGPALSHLAGWLILREKISRISVISSIMLTLVVAFAAFFN
jgi:glucose uptake protein GlcU